MDILNLLTVAVLAYVGFRLVGTVRHTLTSPDHVVAIVRGLRPRHFFLALPTLGGVIAVAIPLMAVPGLSFGWWTAIGGEGNPVVGEGRPGAVGPLENVLPVVFVSLLILALPLLVEGEEFVFRRGAEGRSWTANGRRAVLFGLVHAVVGVPIGVALALSVGGVYFTWAYLREWRATQSVKAALAESTRSHLAYNLVIVGILVFSLALGI